MTCRRRPLRPLPRRARPDGRRLAARGLLLAALICGAGAAAAQSLPPLFLGPVPLTGDPGLPPAVLAAPQITLRTAPGAVPSVVGRAPYAAEGFRRPPRRPADMPVVTTFSPRPPERPPLHVPLEVVAPLPPRGMIVQEMLPDFTGLTEHEARFGPAQVAPVDAARADDLVRARVSAGLRATEGKAALDETAAVAYAACATAGYAAVNGFEWLRHVRTQTESVRGGRAAESIFLLAPGQPEGRAMNVGAVLAACEQNGVPIGDRTGE
ncbi:hypothetical protein ACEYYB_01775 [Paracoccus sp. p4-l81]|uniref:hypothetical protein n=1 Tax=unclassified Paracoccus (in: a-proteobacteria) TaxID=2688777 RepID=UPI0035B6D58B